MVNAFLHYLVKYKLSKTNDYNKTLGKWKTASDQHCYD